MTHPTILIVDDEPAIQAVLLEAVQATVCGGICAGSVAEAVAIIDREHIDVAIIDKNLPDGSGLDIARKLKESDSLAQFILITAYASVDSAVEALQLGAFDYVKKPFDDIRRLGLVVQNALDKTRLQRDQRRLMVELTNSEQRYALAALGANDGLWDWDLGTDTVHFSPRWKEMLGYKLEELGTAPDEWLSRVHPDDGARVRSVIDNHLAGHSDHFEDEHRLAHKDGTFRWVLVRGIATRDAHGKAVRMAGSQTDVTERRLAEQQMQYDALHDPVTYLPNRTLFLDRLGQALARARRRPEFRFAVLLLDLDRFKFVNDSLGHSAGDQLLVATARRLETCLRAGDTAARLGGDEFAILVEDLQDPTDAIRVAERIQASTSSPLVVQGQDVFTTSSIGIALSSHEHQRPEELLRDADVAMYRAKALGKARHVVFDPVMQSRAAKILELDTSLRHAIDRQEFVLHYQPIIHLAERRVVGFEALVRWRHPERGLVPPMEFIPTAEETGLIIPLSDLVLSKAADQLAHWKRDNPSYADLYVSVNVSSKHLVFPGLVETVRNILHVSGLSASSFHLEVTESAIMDNSEIAAMTLEKLKALGVQVALDDFGTGYSSLSYFY